LAEFACPDAQGRADRLVAILNALLLTESPNQW
jgi:hypothetical protein